MLQVSSREGATSGDELARGLPGEPLTKGDRTLLELKPLKAFLPGEVNKIRTVYDGIFVFMSPLFEVFRSFEVLENQLNSWLRQSVASLRVCV